MRSSRSSLSIMFLRLCIGDILLRGAGRALRGLPCGPAPMGNGGSVPEPPPLLDVLLVSHDKRPVGPMPRKVKTFFQMFHKESLCLFLRIMRKVTPSRHPSSPVELEGLFLRNRASRFVARQKGWTKSVPGEPSDRGPFGSRVPPVPLPTTAEGCSPFGILRNDQYEDKGENI